MSFSTLCHERFSARKYIDKKVEEEKIAAILDAGRVAPTPINNQPQRIYLTIILESFQKIRGITPCTFGADGFACLRRGKPCVDFSFRGKLQFGGNGRNNILHAHDVAGKGPRSGQLLGAVL